METLVHLLSRVPHPEKSTDPNTNAQTGLGMKIDTLVLT